MVQLYSRVSRSLALPISKMPRFIIPLADKLDSSIGGMPKTFARNSTATYIDNDGILQTAGIDVIRFQNGRYLCEPAATNSFTYSGDISLDITDANNLISDPLYPGPFSDINANLVDLTSGTQYIYKTMSLVAGTYCFSQYVKLGTAPSVGYGIYSVTTAAWVVEQTQYTGLSALEYKRVNVVFTLATNQTIRIYLKRYIDAATLGTSYHFGGQVETGTQATSYIPTTSVAVTRAADALHYTVGDVITQGQGSLYCEFYNTEQNSGASRVLLCLSDGTSSNRLYFQINASNILTFLVVTGGTTVGYIAGSVSSVVGLNKVLFTYVNNNMRLYHNGVTAGEDLSGVIGVTMSRLSAGCLENSTTQANRGIGNIRYFKETLPGAESIKLTTL